MKRKEIDADINVAEIDLGSIKINNSGLLRLEHDAELVESIRRCGLLNPLTINERFELLAGGRRYTALKALGHKKVSVAVYRSPKSDPENRTLFEELVQIDENLIRKSLDDVAAEEQLVRRKIIYEALYPEARHGTAGAIAKMNKAKKVANDNLSIARDSFTKDTARRTGKSKRTVERALLRGEAASPKVKEARSKRELGASHVDELVKLSSEEQDQILPLAKGKSVEEVKRIVTTVQENGMGITLELCKEPAHLEKLLSDVDSSSKKLCKLLDRMLEENVAVKYPLGLGFVYRFEELKNKIDRFFEHQREHGSIPPGDLIEEDHEVQ